MRRILLLPLLIFVLLAFSSRDCRATLLVYEGFDTTTSGDATHYDQNATVRNKNLSRLGFTGSWTAGDAFASSVDFYARLPGLETGSLLEPAAGRVELFRSGGSSLSLKHLERDLSYSFAPSDDIWVSFGVNYHFETPDTTPSNFLSVILNDTAGVNYDLVFNIDKDGATTLKAGGVSASTLDLGTLSESPTTTMDPTHTHFVVLKAEDSAAGPSNVYDLISVWVDPDDPVHLGAPTATGFGIVREQTAVDGVVSAYDEFRFEGITMPVGYRAWVDEFYMGTTRADVAGVPEPATLLIWSLLAGLGVGLGWRRRK